MSHTPGPNDWERLGEGDTGTHEELYQGSAQEAQPVIQPPHGSSASRDNQMPTPQAILPQGIGAPAVDPQVPLSLQNLTDADRQWMLTQLMNQLSMVQAPNPAPSPPTQYQTVLPSMSYTRHGANTTASPNQTISHNPIPKVHHDPHVHPALSTRPPPYSKKLPSPLDPWKKSEINIVVVGETGVGKTTFMSYVDNMCHGRTVEEFQNTYNRDAERGGQVSESQTYKATLYTFERKDTGRKQIVRILDTPGLGDTRGIEQDDKHKKLVVEEIQKRLDTIDAVIIMANGTNERLGISTNYALENIKAMFPRSLLENIGFILSNCTRSRASFDMRTLPPELQNAEHWMFENPLALWNKYRASKDRGLVRNEEDLEEIRADVDKAYNNGVKTLNKLFAWLDKRSVQPTESILDLYDKLNRIDTEITNLLARIAAAEKTRISVLDLQHQMDQSDRIIDLNRQYEKILNRTRWVREDTNYHSTLCSISSCHSNCHESCTLEFLMDPKEIGDRCATFVGQPGEGLTKECVQCGHSASQHRHYTNIWVERQYTESEVDADAKREFERATSDKQRIQILRTSTQVKLGELEEELRQSQDQIAKLCEQYGQLAISPSFASYMYATIQYLQQLLESRKKAAAPAEELGRLEDLIKDMMGRYKIVAGRAYTAQPQNQPASSQSYGQRQSTSYQPLRQGSTSYQQTSHLSRHKSTPSNSQKRPGFMGRLFG